MLIEFCFYSKLSLIIVYCIFLGGEAAKMLVETYSNRPNWNKANCEEMKKALSEKYEF